MGYRKNLGPTGIEPMTFRTPRSDALTKARGERGHIQVACMTCVLRIARISNVEVFIFVIR